MLAFAQSVVLPPGQMLRLPVTVTAGGVVLFTVIDFVVVQPRESVTVTV